MTTLEADTEPVELRAFRDEARAWLEAHAARRHHDTSEFKRRVAAAANETTEDERAHVDACRAWQRRLFDGGYGGISVPREYGGRGESTALERVWRQEVARYEVDVGMFAVALGMVVPTLLAHGTEEQKHRFIPPTLRGETVWCQLFSEPGAGSDLAGLTTRAVRDGDEWVVTGQKVWNSFAHVADWGILLARTDWDVPKHRGISYFLVDMRTAEVEARPLRQITGVSHFNETFLTEARIPEDQLVGAVNGGWGVAQTTLMSERALISGGMGLGFRDYVEVARHFGRTDDPDIRQRLAAAYTRFEILKWLGRRAQAAGGAGKALGPESSVAKLAMSEHTARNGDLALAIQGAGGMLSSRDAHEDGFWQQQFLGQWGIRIGGGTEQVQRNIIGERVLGLPSEPRPDKTEPFRDIPKN